MNATQPNFLPFTEIAALLERLAADLIKHPLAPTLRDVMRYDGQGWRVDPDALLTAVTPAKARDVLDTLRTRSGGYLALNLLVENDSHYGLPEETGEYHFSLRLHANDAVYMDVHLDTQVDVVQRGLDGHNALYPLYYASQYGISSIKFNAHGHPVEVTTRDTITYPSTAN